MVKGPEFYIRFVEYVFGDEIRIMAPTIGLIIMILMFILATFIGTALYFHFRQRQRAELLDRQVNAAREKQLHKLEDVGEQDKTEIRKLNAELTRYKKTMSIVQTLIHQADYQMWHPTKIKEAEKGDK